MAKYTHYPSERAKDLMHAYMHPNPFIHVNPEEPMVGYLLDLCAPVNRKRPQLRPAELHKRVELKPRATETAEPVYPQKSMVSYRRELRSL